MRVTMSQSSLVQCGSVSFQSYVTTCQFDRIDLTRKDKVDKCHSCVTTIDIINKRVDQGDRYLCPPRNRRNAILQVMNLPNDLLGSLTSLFAELTHLYGLALP
jgi:hypothetical protein